MKTWLGSCAIVLQDVAMGRNWIEGTEDLSAIFLTTAFESVITSQ